MQGVFLTPRLCNLDALNFHKLPAAFLWDIWRHTECVELLSYQPSLFPHSMCNNTDKISILLFYLQSNSMYRHWVRQVLICGQSDISSLLFLTLSLSILAAELLLSMGTVCQDVDNSVGHQACGEYNHVCWTCQRESLWPLYNSYVTTHLLYRSQNVQTQNRGSINIIVGLCGLMYFVHEYVILSSCIYSTVYSVRGLFVEI